MSSALIVGGSTGVGRALATELAKNGWSLMLLARGERDLAATAADLRARYGHTCIVRAADVGDPQFDVVGVVTEAFSLLPDVCAVFLPIGANHPDDEGSNEAILSTVMATNFMAPARFAAVCAKEFVLRQGGEVVAFSSIAASAVRKKNTAYSAAKGALEIYLAGLRHGLVGTSVLVKTYVLGYVDTQLSFGQKLLFPVAPPQQIARAVVRQLGRDTGKVFLPKFWYLVTTLLRHLPWFVFKRLKF